MNINIAASQPRWATDVFILVSKPGFSFHLISKRFVLIWFREKRGLSKPFNCLGVIWTYHIPGGSNLNFFQSHIARRTYFNFNPLNLHE